MARSVVRVARNRSATLIRLVSVSAVLGALLVTAGGAGSAPKPREGCEIPSDRGLAAQQKAPRDSHFPYQEWIANENAQRGVAAANAAVGERFGATDDSDHLAAGVLGLVPDHHGRKLVLVVDASVLDLGEADRFLKSKVPPGTLNVKAGASCNTAAELVEARAVLRAADWHPDAATSEYGFHVDAHTSTMHVTFDTGATELASSLEARLGELVTIEFGDVGPRGRLDDGEPHWGGAGIRRGSDSSNICTSAFTAIQPDGSRGSVTAGHCANNGNNIYSGPQFYGEATGESATRWDMIRIHPRGESFERKIHVDPCCPVVRSVVAAGDPGVGDYVCVSGMVTRAVCGIEITRTDAELYYMGVNHTNMIKGVKNGYLVGQGGDSGAPVYNRYGSSDAAIRGMETAGTAYDNFYGFKTSTIRNVLGVSGIAP